METLSQSFLFQKYQGTTGPQIYIRERYQHKSVLYRTVYSKHIISSADIIMQNAPELTVHLAPANKNLARRKKSLGK